MPCILVDVVMRKLGNVTAKLVNFCLLFWKRNNSKTSYFSYSKEHKLNNDAIRRKYAS